MVIHSRFRAHGRFGAVRMSEGKGSGFSTGEPTPAPNEATIAGVALMIPDVAVIGAEWRNSARADSDLVRRAKPRSSRWDGSCRVERTRGRHGRTSPRPEPRPCAE